MIALFQAFARSALGLPDRGFVFCCFNNSFKITPAVFDTWMRILRQVNESVLWLLNTNLYATANLQREATKGESMPNDLSLQIGYNCRALSKASCSRLIFGHYSVQCSYDGKRCTMGRGTHRDANRRNFCRTRSGEPLNGDRFA